MEDFSHSDIEMLIFCVDFVSEIYKRIPFKTFKKITSGKITKEQAFNELNIIKSKLKNL